MENGDSGNYSKKKTESNREKIEIELRRLNPDISDNQVDLYAEDLAEIPQNEISPAFRLARRRNLKFKIPNIGQILEAWESLKFKAEDWKGTSGAALDNARKHGYYTIHSLPAVYMPERWRYLIQQHIAGNLTDDEWIELAEVRKVKVFRPQLRLNEKIAEKIQIMENPDEMVEISKYKHLFKEIIKNV